MIESILTGWAQQRRDDELVEWLGKEPGPVAEPDVPTYSEPVPGWYEEEVAFVSAPWDGGARADVGQEEARAGAPSGGVPWFEPGAAPADEDVFLFFDPPMPQIDARCDRELGALDENEASCPAPPILAKAGDCVGTWSDPETCPCTYEMVPEVDDVDVMYQDPLFAPVVWQILDPDWPVPIIHGYSTENDLGDKGPIVPQVLDVRMLLAVWRFLFENVDIAAWIVCLLEGPNNADQFMKRFAPAPFTEDPQHIKLADGLPFGCGLSDSTMCTGWASNKIHINITADSWLADRDQLFAPMTLEAADRLCVLLPWVLGLFHEMLHGVLGVFNESQDDSFVPKNEAVRGWCGCDTTDMAEAAFAWAIRKRYPCLGSSTNGCAPWSDDCFWLNACETDRGELPEFCA